MINVSCAEDEVLEEAICGELRAIHILTKYKYEAIDSIIDQVEEVGEAYERAKLYAVELKRRRRL